MLDNAIRLCYTYTMMTERHNQGAMMTMEELQLIQRTFWHRMLKTLVLSLVGLGYYLYFKG